MEKIEQKCTAELENCSSQHKDQLKLPGLQAESMLWNRNEKKVMAVTDLLYDWAVFKLFTHNPKYCLQSWGVRMIPDKNSRLHQNKKISKLRYLVQHLTSKK